MSRIHLATSGMSAWRSGLADPDKHWKRRYSAFEAAAAWELAGTTESGLPAAIAEAFRASDFGESRLLIGVAEHKVRLRGRGHDSQCDLWALIATGAGQLSLTVEAKANEPFGNGHQPLVQWLDGTNDASRANRRVRWENVRENLPVIADEGYHAVPFQLLHRCAVAVIEARRFGLTQAAMLVQAFGSPASSFDEYAKLSTALGLVTERGRITSASVGSIRLGIGWVDCPFATDAQVASVESAAQF